jgi:hypothetical protein
MDQLYEFFKPYGNALMQNVKDFDKYFDSSWIPTNSNTTSLDGEVAGFIAITSISFIILYRKSLARIKKYTATVKKYIRLF